MKSCPPMRVSALKTVFPSIRPIWRSSIFEPRILSADRTNAASKSFLTLLILLFLAAAFVDACSWNNPVWTKSALSDTPLFRFVIGLDKNARAGYIDANGNVVIPPTLQTFGNQPYDDFFDGIALVQLDGQYWYITSKGEKLFRGRRSGTFSEGFADFEEGGKDGYLNTRGEVAIPAKFESAGRFSEGLAAVQAGGKYGYIDQKGIFVVKPSFAMAFWFKNGLARVIKQSGCLYIGYAPCDAFNPLVLPFNLSKYNHPTMKEPRCKYSFIDRTGRDVALTTYREAKDFAERLAPVGNGRVWGFVDTGGTLTIPMQYQNAEPFSEGLAAVQMNGKWGYVNHTGKLVIPPIFLAAFPFSEGMAVTLISGWEYEFIDKAGRRAIPGSFTGASSFVMGLAHVRSGVNYESATWAYIDHVGHPVFRYSERGALNR